MPSKGKKSSRPSPAAAAASSGRSPLFPRSPSTPSRDSPRKDRDSEDPALHRRLLADAAFKFPALVSEAATFFGRLADAEASPSKGNRARVWLSEASMVSSALAPGSLVSVSLVASSITPSSNFPLDSLVDRCAIHFGFDVNDRVGNMPGRYFAIASVFPSRKVLKNEVHISWGLSCTMGFPTMGRMVFICPIESIPMSQQLNNGKSGNHTNFCKCKDLYLNLIPPKAGLDSCSKSTTTVADLDYTESKEVELEKTPSQQSKLSSSSASSMRLNNPHDLVSSSVSSSCLDFSSVKLALEDVKLRELLQIYAARWLHGRHLLDGNVVTVPICGEICPFLLESPDLPHASCSAQDLTSDEHDLLLKEIQISCSVDQLVMVLVVDTGTRVHLSSSMSLKLETIKKVDFPAEDFKYEEVSRKKTGTVKKLGGLSKEFAAVKEIISFSLMNTDGFPRYKGVLLHGPPGTGKTSLACSCAHDVGANLFSINGPEIISQYYGESEQALHEVFNSAKQSAPAVVFIDELDAIAPARKEGGEELSLRMVATLLKLMDEISNTDRMIVIAATNRPDSIDPALRRPGRLDREIEIGVPSPEQRLDILQTLLNEMDNSLSREDIHSLAFATHGFVGADLAALCNEAAMCALRRHIQLKNSCHSGLQFERRSGLDGSLDDLQGGNLQKNDEVPSANQIDALAKSLSTLTMSQGDVSLVSSGRVRESCFCSQDRHYEPEEVKKILSLKVTIEDIEKAKMKVRPSGMREVMLELPNVRWEDVGGQAKVKKQLIEAVQWPQLCPDAFERIGIRPPRGLLMIGPPGCSKTLMARAVASEAKLNFLAVKGPELFSKWVGESEKAVRALFAKARANSPAILFFDEIDGLAVTRGKEDDGTSVSDRVLSQLLQEMDGLEQRAGITVIAATNRPDKIDPALLRPGRFDRLLDVQPPDESDRQDIFRIHMRNMPCSPDVDPKDLAHLTEGYTGADIKLICREAAISALEESLEISEVSLAHFMIGISRVQPSDVHFYRELAAQFRRLVDDQSVKG